ncbi:MAG TPA: BtpA/SgcQ family protein [Thermoanaerobaculia bacterium]|nr:BtpA/SgcQ family protein [Thermoanaerobaculia bacterium]
MLTREGFREIYGSRPLFGMVHLAALPGAPLFGGSMDAVIDAALRDAKAIEEGGGSGLLFENFSDRPFRRGPADPETIAAMTVVIREVTREIALPFGVNVLRNDARSALAIATVTAARFVRINVHTGAMVTDQGIIEGAADETTRRRAALGVACHLFCDHLVKHAVPLAAIDENQSLRDLRARGLADAIIITGKETGAAAEPDRLQRARETVDAPLILGSGLTPFNAAVYAPLVDGAIAGTGIKEGGVVENRVARERVARLVEELSRS